MHAKISRKFQRLALATALALGAGAAHATDVTGAGSSFVYPIMSKWAASYASQSGVRVNYQSIGSGAGIAQIKAGTVDFGASDKPLSADELRAAGLGQFPIVIGGIVPIVNVAGLTPGQLRLDGATLAKIFLGEIKFWNANPIMTLNPGLRLPAAPITVVHRSDGSGTSFNFTHYLAQVSPEWQARVGEGSAVAWPTGVGGKGNEGVAAYVRQIPGSIGYVEYAYAKQSRMAHAQLHNAAGRFVQPGSASFQAAAATADWNHAEDFNLLMTNAPGATAWPITATTWVILRQQSADPVRSRAAFAFFAWSMQQGQAQAAALDYVALPAALVERIQAYWPTRFKQ